MSAERYPACLRWLHWLVAVGVLAQLALGWVSEAISSEAGMGVLRVHFQLGVMVFLLMALRVLCRLRKHLPSADPGAPVWRRRCAAGVQAALYLLLLLLPVSGYVIWVWMDAPRQLLGVLWLPALFVPPADDESWRALAWYVHVGGAWVLSLLVVLHVAAAAWHQWWRRDGLISRRLL